MNIRRFVAADIRKVLREVRAALGPDAVILSTNNVDSGVEVIAAIDYDDTLIERWADGGARNEIADRDLRTGEPAQEPARDDDSPRSPTAAYASVAAAAAGGAESEDRVELTARGAGRTEATRTEPAVQTRAPRSDVPPELAMELSGLRELLEHQLSSLAWNDTSRRNPVYARTLRQYAKLGIDPAIARRLAVRIPKKPARGSPWRLPLQALAERLPLAKHDLADLKGAYAIVGPTGVGKTTTIAKIAARFVLRHGVARLGLVTTDAYRIGARDQLMTFARILGTPMHTANDAAEMRAVLATLAHKRLILIDTAGMSQRDARLTQQFAALRGVGSAPKTVLALSAASDLGCMRDALKRFGAAVPVGLIATKLDEAVSLGPMLSLVLESGLPLAYLSDGQRVPEDLHLAAHRRSWLIRTAMDLARQNPRGVGEAELAAAYGGMGLVANG